MSEKDPDAARQTFRVAFVPGVTPDKWFRLWRERVSGAELIAVPLEDAAGQDTVLSEGRADMLLGRLPLDDEGLHVIPLYSESPVVVAAKGHTVEAATTVDVTELAGEHLIQHPDDVPEWRDVAHEVLEGTRVEGERLTPRQAMEVASSGAGIVIVPLSVARQYERKDLIRRPVTGVAETRIGLCWPEAAESELIEQFIGVVRGRSPRSTRAPGSAEAEQRAAKQRAAQKKDAARQSAERARERKNAVRASRRAAGGHRRGRR